MQGRPPTAEQAATGQAEIEHWNKVAREFSIQALARTEEAAKQLVVLTGILQGLYFAVFAVSDLRQHLGSPWLQLIFFSPLLLWLISLYYATQVFVPKVRGVDLNDADPRTWQRVRQTYDDVGQEKLAFLHRAHRFLVASFGLILLLLVFWVVVVPPAPDAGPTRVILLTPTVSQVTPTP